MNKAAFDFLATEIKGLTDASYKQGNRDVVITFLEIYDQFGTEVMVAGMRQFLAENPSQLEALKDVGLGRDVAAGSGGETAHGGA